MGNFSIALSGLEANSVALNTIGNNLANLNTTAFKGQTTSFENLFYQQIGQSGSGDAIQVGAGTKVAGTSTDYSEGTLLPDSNANPTDMALDGNGFFIVERNGVQSLTRAGNFQISQNGTLTTQDGQTVMGYPVVSGVANQNGAAGGAQATQNISATVNLDSGATVGTTFTTPVTLYDSLGQSHNATITYNKTGTNTWGYSVALPAGDATGTPVNNTGTLTFDASGNLTSPSGNISGISFPGMADGASDLSFNWNLTDAGGNPTLTQLASVSTNGAQTQDGFASGTFVNNVVNQNASLQPITIPIGATEGAQATQNISATVNLNSGATVGTTFTTPVKLYDSLGQSHNATITYNKTGTNAWSYSIALPAGDATGSPVNSTGTLTFDSDGNLTSPSGSVTEISFQGMADGASDLTFNWNLTDASGNPTMTQLASASTNGTQNQDGFPSGTYTTIKVDSSGVITAQFSNGNETTIGQLAIASVANVQGLIATGGNNFQTTVASGQATAGVAGAGGRGMVDDNTLEQSNVNISTEFSNLIVAQRAFEANSKTVTTFDTISQDVLAMVR